MTDTIASRVTRVIGGSVHALLDAVENAAPESAMSQAIREIDQALDEVRAELGRVEAVKHLATSSLNKLNSQNEGLAGQIEIAMAKGDEALARAGIARQVDIEDQIPVLQRSLHDAMDRSREARRLHSRACGQEARDGVGAGRFRCRARSSLCAGCGRRRGRRQRDPKQRDPGQGRARGVSLRPRACPRDRHCRRHVAA